MSTMEPPRSFIRVGMAMTLVSVLQRVRTTERATSAPPIRQTMFDAAPPGQQETRRRPAASCGGRLRTEPRRRPLAGMMMYWEETPRSTTHGRLRTTAKSEKERVRPMPSIIVQRTGPIQAVANQRKVGGWAKAATAPRNTQRGKREVRVFNRRSRTVVGGGEGCGGTGGEILGLLEDGGVAEAFNDGEGKD